MSDRVSAKRPLLRVVRGEPTPEEVAALVTALTARARAAAARAEAARRDRPPSAWRDRSRYLRTPLPHGPGAWRTSARPR